MGKNDPTESLLLYTNPQDGYASHSMVDLDILGVGKNNDISSESLIGKISMLAAPYLVCGGMNEKGVFIGIEELETEPIHQDNEKTDLLLFLAVRAMLDRCTSTDECIYNQMTVIDTNYCTNFQLSPGKDYWVGIGQDRYGIVEKKLTSCNNILDENAAFYSPYQPIHTISDL